MHFKSLTSDTLNLQDKIKSITNGFKAKLHKFFSMEQEIGVAKHTHIFTHTHTHTHMHTHITVA